MRERCVEGPREVAYKLTPEAKKGKAAQFKPKEAHKTLLAISNEPIVKKHRIDLKIDLRVSPQRKARGGTRGSGKKPTSSRG